MCKSTEIFTGFYAVGLDHFQRNEMSPSVDRQAILQTIKDVRKACGNELKKLNYKGYKSCHDCDIPLT